MSERVVRCLVSGRVQGVWFRASTKNKACELGLRGRVSNLANGNVEVVIAGQPVAVSELCQWLWEGPPAAVVTGVTVGETDETVGEDFSVV